MTGWAPNTVRVIDNGYGGSRGGAEITGGVLHHTDSLDALGYVAGWNNRNSHPTYHVDRQGRQTGIVHPSRRPVSTANGVDAFAITFEIDNIALGGDFPVSAEALATVAETLAWHAAQSPRRGHPLEVNDPSRTQAGFWVGWHRQYVPTICPGPFVIANLSGVVHAANGAELPAPATPAPPTAPATLVVDGIIGPLTTMKLQAATGAVVDGIWGRETTSKLQARVGAKVDGILGPETRTKTQRYLGVTQDGIWGPITIKELQRRLNAGTF